MNLPLVAFGLTLVALAALLVHAWRFPSSRLPGGEGRALSAILEPGDLLPEALLAQPVTRPDGSRVGETVAAHGSTLILKSENGFLALPLDAVVSHANLLVAEGGWDPEEAAREGEAWRSGQHDDLGEERDAVHG